MRFQILSIILWPRQSQFEPRVVSFDPNSVNVISGRSRTGKSAIIPIIDYCLGSEKCTIPVATIRDACSWFGIVVQTDYGQKLFARREPGAQRATGDMYVADGDVVEIPKSTPTKNANVDFVKGQLDHLAGLTSLDFEPNSTSGFKARPGFRDLMAFVFQPQNVVANPNTLFYKADSFEHREKLRVLFPYVLGAVTPELLAKRHELDELKRLHRKKKLELESIRHVSERFLSQMYAHLNRLKEFGLISAEVATDVDHYQGIKILRAALDRSSEIISAGTSAETISASSDELVELRQQEAEQAIVLAGLRQRFLEMTELRKNTVDYRNSLDSQKDRLAISTWLEQRMHDEHDCPVCGSSMGKQKERAGELIQHLAEIEASATQFQTLPASLDREYQRVRAEITRVSEALAAVQFRLRQLRDSSELEQKRQYTELSMSRYVGRIETDLRVLESVGQDSALQDELNALDKQIKALEGAVNPEAIKGRINRALQKVSSFAAQIVPKLDVERPTDAVSLSIPDLTVKVQGVDREDFLWEIGSGSNWLSYHIAISVALQRYFAEQKESPVPHFLVYDQPSQVYFPQHLVEREEESNDPEFKDEDVEAVSKVFRALSDAIDEDNRGLQFIVLDHAPPAVWNGIPNIHYVEEWRGNNRLIPLAWLANSSEKKDA